MFLVDQTVGETIPKARAVITAVGKAHVTIPLNVDDVTPTPTEAVCHRDKALRLVMVLEAVIISVMDQEAEDIRKRTAKPTGAARQTSNTAMTAKAISGLPLKVPHPLHATATMLLRHVTTLKVLPHAIAPKPLDHLATIVRRANPALQLFSPSKLQTHRWSPKRDSIPQWWTPGLTPWPSHSLAVKFALWTRMALLHSKRTPGTPSTRTFYTSTTQ
jgi:hypothetical protein